MMEIVERPAIFGSAIICDDIRREDTGKAIYLGVYDNAMFIHGGFPATLSKLSFSLSFNQAAADFEPNLSFKIFLPGDPDDTPSIEGNFVETDDGAAIKAANVSSSHVPESERKFLAVRAMFSFDQFVIKEPGLLRVMVQRRNKLYKIGGLRIAPGQPAMQNPIVPSPI